MIVIQDTEKNIIGMAKTIKGAFDNANIADYSYEYIKDLVASIKPYSTAKYKQYYITKWRRNKSTGNRCSF